MGDLLAAASDPGCLAEAWQQALDADAADERLSAGVRRFAADAD
ncbi:hypothetical protein [Kutzneria buriramensis]|nr:hypothetical protein [Kutzneria buriramensis]